MCVHTYIQRPFTAATHLTKLNYTSWLQAFAFIIHKRSAAARIHILFEYSLFFFCWCCLSNIFFIYNNARSIIAGVIVVRLQAIVVIYCCNNNAYMQLPLLLLLLPSPHLLQLPVGAYTFKEQWRRCKRLFTINCQRKYSWNVVAISAIADFVAVLVAIVVFAGNATALVVGHSALKHTYIYVRVCGCLNVCASVIAVATNACQRVYIKYFMIFVVSRKNNNYNNNENKRESCCCNNYYNCESHLLCLL